MKGPTEPGSGMWRKTSEKDLSRLESRSFPADRRHVWQRRTSRGFLDLGLEPAEQLLEVGAFLIGHTVGARTRLIAYSCGLALTSSGSPGAF